MASAAELRAQNEDMTRKIYALLSANTTLEKEVMELTSERDELQSIGSKKVQTLEQKLEKVDEELTSLRSQCESISEIIKNTDENKIEVEDEPAPIGRKLSSAINQTLQRAKGMSMPTQRQSSTVKMVAHGITKAASFMAPPVEKSGLDARRPKMNENSPPILSYAKSASGSTKSLLISAHSHYGNFRRRSGPYRKNCDPVMVL